MQKSLLKKFIKNRINPFLRRLSKEKNNEALNEGTLCSKDFLNIGKAVNKMVKENELDNLKNYYQKEEKEWKKEEYYEI